MKKIVSTIIIAIIGTLLIIGAFKIFRIPTDFITYERIVENVEKRSKCLF